MTKPIVLHTGRNGTVAERRKREQQEDIYRVGRLRLVPPDELSERAKMKFQQIANEAFWLDELSVDLLSAYCDVWDKWLNTVEAMKGQNEIIIQRRKDGRMYKQNPYRIPLRTYITTMEELSGKLGLGNIDRLKLSLPVTKDGEKPEENPFEEFMAKVE